MTERRKGIVARTDFVRQELSVYAAMLPVGTRVQHTGGRVGTVRLDNPATVPGVHAGRPTAWCLTDLQGSSALVCVAWDNDSGLTWLSWVPADSVERTSASRVNRPSLAAKGR